MPRIAPKRDGNEKQIIAALRAYGATIAQVDGRDIPDLSVGKHGVNVWLEVKDKRGKLTTGQKQWHGAWNGQVGVARTIEEALQIVEEECGKVARLEQRIRELERLLVIARGVNNDT